MSIHIDIHIDIHVIQSVPPSCINRDDTGSPKNAMYGGVQRARVSSQSWKRATRVDFEGRLMSEQHSIRTERIKQVITEQIVIESDISEEEAARITGILLAPLGIKPNKKKDEQTSYLLFFGMNQVQRVVRRIDARGVERLVAMDDDELSAELVSLDVKNELGTGHPIGVALFGRMVADLADLNVDAAVQVAHAISTHEVATEFDYFTAVDDKNSAAESGAGHIDSTEFNSSTLYRHATVNLSQLLRNLDNNVETTLTALRLFISSFVTSMPTGHQNTFAHRTVPALVSVMVRTGQPVNLVSAFDSPVQTSSGLTERSVVRLAEETVRMEQWGLTPSVVASTYVTPEDDTVAPYKAAFGASVPFADVVETIIGAAREHLNGS